MSTEETSTQKSDTHGYVGELDNVISSDDVEIFTVKDTPFSIVREKGDLWYITVGNFRVSEGIEDKRKAFTQAKKVDWNKITAVMAVMMERYTPEHAMVKEVIEDKN